MSFLADAIISSSRILTDRERENILPNKQDIINNLKLWVYITYKGTSQHQRAQNYLDLCINKISLQILRSSTSNLINKYKSQIHHALERDRLSQQIKFLHFENNVLKKIQSNQQTYQTKKQEEEELQLKKRVKVLHWENSVLQSLHSLQIKSKKVVLQKFPSQKEIDNQIISVKQRVDELKKEFKSLQKAIKVENITFQQKKEEINDLEKEVEQCFKETLKKEEELQKYQVCCLQKIKDLQEEIDQYIEKIKLEPQRLNEAFIELDEEFKIKMEKIFENFQLQLKEMLRKQEEKIKAQEKEYNGSFDRENENFQSQKDEINQRYNQLGQENYEKFQKEFNELFSQFNKEVILNKEHYHNRWQIINYAAHQDRVNAFFNGNPPSSANENEEVFLSEENRIDNLSDKDPIFNGIFQERDKEIPSYRNEINLLFERMKIEIVNQITHIRNAFTVEHEKQIARINQQNQIPRKQQELLNQRIKEKLKHLLKKKNDI